MRRIALIILAAFVIALIAGSCLTTSSDAAFVRVRNFFACAPIPIAINTSVNSTLETGDCVDTNTAFFDGYTFTGTAGELIDVTQSSQAFAPSLRLVQGSFPGGTVIATGTGTGNEVRRISGFTIPSAGTYTIVASSASAGSSGLYSLAFESTNPRVTAIERLNPDPALAGSTVGFSVNFTSGVTGVDAADFVLTTTGVSGAAITNVAGNGSVYTVAVNSGSGAGTIRLDLLDNDSIVGVNGVPLGGAGQGNANFTSGQIYTLNLAGMPSPTPQPSVVVTNVNDSGPGSLRQAIANVISGGSITFSTLFDSPQTILLTGGELRVLKNITITGPGPQLLTISGNNASRVFNIGQSNPGNTVAISGLRIANGRAPDGDFGGGIEQNFGTLTITNCEFTGNAAPPESAGFGGAIDFFEGTLNIVDSTISGNSSSINGGGIAVASTSLTISNTTIAGNSSGSGGGLQIFGGVTTITGSTLSGNIVTNRGGAIFGQNCSISIDNSTISGNIADAATEAIAAAIAFEANSGTRTAQITGTTIANNAATPNEVGAILAVARSGSSVSVNVILRNTLLAGNSEPAMQSFGAGGASSAISSQGFNLSTASGNSFLNQSTDRQNAVAAIAPLASNGGRTQTHRLLAQSAAIDAGNGFGLINDQRGSGFARSIDLIAANAAGGDGTDIGSFELQTEPLVSLANISGRVSTPTGQNLRNAIVTITDPQGVRRTATTSSFGIFTFTEVATGVSYVVTATSKRFRFAPQSLALSTSVSNLDFVGLE